MKRKAKHLLGKKNQRPQTQGELLFFLPKRCLGLADWHPTEKTRGEFFRFCYMKFLNLVCQLSFSSTVRMEDVLQKNLGGQFFVTVEARNKNRAVWGLQVGSVH